MKIYTRKGDRGETAILGGGRRSKADARIRALGGLDEANAAIGLVLAESGVPIEVEGALRRIQEILFEAGAAVAALEPATAASLFSDEAHWLETEIDRAQERLPELRQFILPGGGPVGARLHWARAVARRAESLLVEALADEPERVPLFTWMNRLSDALFVLARLANQRSGANETRWTSRPKEARKESTDPEKGGPPAPE